MDDIETAPDEQAVHGRQGSGICACVAARAHAGVHVLRAMAVAAFIVHAVVHVITRADAQCDPVVCANPYSSQVLPSR